ncbi:MAG: type II toxin-antitoxin system HicA family toxin [Thermomicrobiales bacterium]
MPKLHRALEVFLRQPIPVEVNREDAEKALTLIGFTLRHHKGSHYVWTHPDGRSITYALVNGRRLKRVAVASIAQEVRKQDAGRDRFASARKEEGT